MILFNTCVSRAGLGAVQEAQVCIGAQELLRAAIRLVQCLLRFQEPENCVGLLKRKHIETIQFAILAYIILKTIPK
jgi:hypothetical protein